MTATERRNYLNRSMAVLKKELAGIGRMTDKNKLFSLQTISHEAEQIKLIARIWTNKLERK